MNLYLIISLSRTGRLLMQYIHYPVDQSLKHLIRYFWSYDADAPASQRLHIRSFADQYPRLVFQDIRTFAPVTDGEGQVMPVCYLSGLDTRPSEAFWESRFSHFGVSFYPDALSVLFRIDAAGLVNELPDIILLDHTGIPGLLLQANNHTERVAILSRYFYQKMKEGKTDPIIHHLLNSPGIHRFPSGMDLAGLAKYYAISERQLQRRFKMSVGVSASRFIRILKFEKSLQLLSSARYGDLSQLTYELEYTDQSHFIKDFKTFSGLSPYEFIRQQQLGSENSSFIYPVSGS